MIEAELLSKVIDNNEFYTMNKYNVTEADFRTYQHVYRYVREYVSEYNETPSYRNVVAKFKDFDYKPEVNDNIRYLCREIKAKATRHESVKRLAKVNENFKMMHPEEFTKWLKEEAEALEAIANFGASTVTNYATNGTERKEWYVESKENRTHSYIATPYPTLTKWLGGGFEVGDYILLLAYTNRGKSWLGSHIGNKAHEEGFGVLHYSPELSKKQQVFRNDTLRGHFDNVAIRRGELKNEDQYYEYLDEFNENKEVPYYIKTMEDLPKGLSTDVIEADLQVYKDVKLIIIDGFNLMQHERIGRDGMSSTSRKLRQLFGRYGVAGLVIHQTPTGAEKEQKVDEDDLEVEIPVPQITDYSETIAVIQDAATVLTFNQKDGRGRLHLAKCREPNVGKILDLRCNFNLGYITESTIVDHF
ncbi:DnaB-like helicase C-terminal domain-containing protein [Priestia megaterium]|uniref:DnaB-like helicase C-terminal domain-containing protein n=1 Tax=Priestia megaterium TaxID=1404 RepID=UPI00285C9C1B|nr:DnaB-like helicase C-terminal domain-containing protein [Priestia megaterium]MDR7207615.1 replicative DNA helicase [Priestia megaterium]